MNRQQHVDGEHVVADDAPVFGPVGLDDVVVVQVLQGWPVPGFSVLPVGGSFRLDHIEGHPQRDRPVSRPAAVGDLDVGVLDDDLVAEISRGPGAGVGDQCLVRVEFEREFIAQEGRQLIFDGLGFGFRSGAPQDVVVCITRIAQPPVPGVLRVDRGELTCLAAQRADRFPVPASAGEGHLMCPPSVFGVTSSMFPSGVLRNQNRLDVSVQFVEVNVREDG